MNGPGVSSPAQGRTWLASAALAVLLAARAGSDDAGRPGSTPLAVWQVGRPLAIAVAGDRARFSIPTPRPGSKTLVIVSALSRAPGPFPVRLAARPAGRATAPALAPEGPRRPPNLNTPPPAPIPTTATAAGPPPRVRTFHLMVEDGDVASPSNYLAVQGRLRAVGRLVQVYVDEHDVGRVGPDVLRDLIATFDRKVVPVAAPTIGQARDVDGDGRFTVLMSSWLTRLAGGRHAVDGFVRGADFDPGLGAPFSNHADMMYLSTALAAGPYLRTVLAHEYTHAVTVSTKTTGRAGGRPGPEEEGWLDEAMAHLSEDLHGFSKANLDYRVSAYLSQPERYRLVVEDYYTADLFRSHGNRGCTYLFLRWCADRYGPGLLPALARSERRGMANLEAATGATFADLYREWSVALYLSGLDPRAQPSFGFRSLDVRGSCDGWELAGPRSSHVTPGGPDHTWSAAGTSSHFAVVGSSPTGAVEVVVSAPPEADLQVTAVPLPADLARLELSARAVVDPDGGLSLRARLSERDGTAVRLTALAWEPLVPASDAHATGFRRDGLGPAGLVSAWGRADLPAGGTLDSRPIRLPGVSRGDFPLIVKVEGTDAGGRRVAAWSEVTAPPSRSEGLAAGGPSPPALPRRGL